MRDISIAFSRPMIRWDIGWPIHPSGAKQRGYLTGHPFDYEVELKTWPWWRRGFHFCRLNRDLPGAAPGWRLWIYSSKGARAIEFFWRPARFWCSAHVHLPRHP